jgi:hypothetical protein
MVSKELSFFVVILLFNIFSSCQSPRRSKSLPETEKTKSGGSEIKKAEVRPFSKEGSSKDSVPNYGQRNNEIGPDDIRVFATVKAIHTPSHAESPCDQYACVAEIFIDGIVQRGRTYAGGIESGQKLIVYFSMTLENSTKVFPGQDIKQFPGLKEGDRFQADISGGVLLDDLAANSPTILTYELIH